MNPSPIVSIVTPSFNHGHFIRETIESILNQSYSLLEYWVIDGCSTDNTLDILRSIRDERFHWISQPDHGQSDALQKGFNHSTGEILGWVNSDDLLWPKSVERAVQSFHSSEDTGFVYGDLLVVDNARNPITYLRPGVLSVKRLLTQNQSITQLGSFYRRTVFEQAGGIDLSLRFGMDYDLFIRLLKSFRGVYIPECLGEFRLHQTSKSFVYTDTLFLRETFRISRRYGAPLFTPLNAKRLKDYLKGLIKRALGMPSVNIERLRKRSNINPS